MDEVASYHLVFDLKGLKKFISTKSGRKGEKLVLLDAHELKKKAGVKNLEYLLLDDYLPLDDDTLAKMRSRKDKWDNFLLPPIFRPLLVYRHISLWDIFEHDFCYQDLKGVLQYYYSITHFLRKINQGKIILYYSNHPAFYLFQNICENKSISIHIKGKREMFTAVRLFGSIFISNAKFWVRYGFLPKLLWFLKKKHKRRFLPTVIFLPVRDSSMPTINQILKNSNKKLVEKTYVISSRSLKWPQYCENLEIDDIAYSHINISIFLRTFFWSFYYYFLLKNRIKHDLFQSPVIENMPLESFLKLWVVEKIIAQSFSSINFLEIVMKLFKKYHDCQKYLILNEHTKLGRSIIYCGKKENKKIMAFQHNLNVDSPKYYSLPLYKMAVWGNITKKMFCRRGVIEDKDVIPVGSPRMDLVHSIYKNYSSNGINHYREKHKIKPKGMIALWAPTSFFSFKDYTKKEWKIHCEIIIDTLLTFSDIHVVVKLRHGDKMEIGAAGYDFVSEPRISLVQDNIYEHIYYCDFIITMESTAGLEAILIGKPVIITELFFSQYVVDFYYKNGAAFLAKNKEDLQKAVEKILYNTNILQKMKIDQQKFLNNYIEPSPINPSERLMRLVHSM